MNWIYLGKDRDKLWVFVDSVMNLRASRTAGNFLTDGENVRFLRTNLLNGVDDLVDPESDITQCISLLTLGSYNHLFMSIIYKNVHKVYCNIKFQRPGYHPRRFMQHQDFKHFEIRTTFTEFRHLRRFVSLTF
jgi:hypothetical protein